MSISLFKQLILADLRAAYRTRNELLNPLVFFAMVVTLFPMTLHPTPTTLHALAPGILWVGVLLALLLSLDRLFRHDYQTGTLDQLLISPHPLPYLVLAKTTAYWLATALPLLIIAPILALLLQMTWNTIGILLLSLLIGTPTLTLLGAIGAALTVALRQSGMLLVLLVLPLYIPVLIFGTSAVVSANDGLSAVSALAFLGALSLLALCFSPFAIATALRIGNY